MKVKLGDEVKDTVTGFTGIVVSIHKYLAGCARASVQPLVDKYGKIPDSSSFDVPLLEVIKRKHEPVSQNTGGPEKYTDHRSI